MADQPTLPEILASLTWEQITEDGIITIDEIEAALRAQGQDPAEFDHLYE
jgi:hypothetical protein